WKRKLQRGAAFSIGLREMAFWSTRSVFDKSFDLCASHGLASTRRTDFDVQGHVARLQPGARVEELYRDPLFLQRRCLIQRQSSRAECLQYVPVLLFHSRPKNCLVQRAASGQIFVTGAVPVDNPAFDQDQRVEEWMRYATVLGLYVIEVGADLCLRIEAEFHFSSGRLSLYVP